MESEWCECGNTKEYTRLLETSTSPFVHAPCGKPTWHTWVYFERFCEECGRSFSSPVAEVCDRCWRMWFSELGVYVSWQALWKAHEDRIQAMRQKWQENQKQSVDPVDHR